MGGPARKADQWSVVVVAGSLAYPLLVYFGLSVLPPLAITCAALALIGLRVLASRGRIQSSPWARAMVVAGALLVLLLGLDQHLAVKAYPVLVSLAVATVFGLSLVHPPTVVERLARLTEPDLSPQGIAYARAVTAVWTGFLLANAVASAAIGLWGSLALWTLYNGLVSYALMGVLLAGELLVRRHLRRQVRAKP